MSINQFAHFTDDEVANKILTKFVIKPTPNRNTSIRSNSRSVSAFVNMNRFFNWANYSVVSPVEPHQGGCGSCYAFASVGVVECICNKK